MIHAFTWGLLITAIALGAWLDKRLDAKEHQFVARHIVLVVVVIGWICFMAGLYLGPGIFSWGDSGYPPLAALWVVGLFGATARINGDSLNLI